MTITVAANELRLLVERVERLEDDKKEVATDIKEVYAEAKSRGYDPAIMKQIVKLRAMDRAQREEAEALLETYKSALGLSTGEYAGRPTREPRDRTPLEEAVERFEQTTEGVAVTMSVAGGPEVPINKAARDRAAASA